MSNTATHNPIQGLALADYRGVHWINASAGTGKTFTLTAIIVRLLCSRYLPKQMIVTTFTRKAVSELRQRIRHTLQDVLDFFQQQRGADNHELTHALQDKKHPLFQLLADEFHNNISYLCERLNLALDQYDELYIGTLDSLTQKLLREFRFETGQTQTLQLTEQQNQLLYQITHDGLRAWIQLQPADLIQQLYQSDFFQSIDDYFNLLKQSLNFKSAEWQIINTTPHQAIDLTQLMQAFQQLDFAGLLAHSSVQSLDSYSRNRLGKITQYQVLDLTDIAQLKPLYQLLQDHQNKFKFLKKATEDDKNYILNHQVILTLNTLFHDLDSFFQRIQQHQLALKSYLIQYTHQHFATRLEQQQETTFAEQTQRLVSALTNDAQVGENLAKIVHHRYPVILVDEFQDTNHDQESILAHIWRHEQRISNGCIVMVGDDKQAIYNFRGGDMLIYRRAEQHVQYLAKKCPDLVYCYTLTENFRSTIPLVEQLQQLFLQQPDFGEGVHYIPVHSRQNTALVENQARNPQPLRYIIMDDSQDINMIEQCTWQIMQLLQQSAQQQLYLDDGQHQRAIGVNDIAVLSSNNNDLDLLHQHLLRHHIPVYRQSYRSVFSHFIARDVAHLLHAILQPYQEQRLKRVLFSRLFGYTVSKVLAMEQSQQLSVIMQKFAKCRELWRQRGFASAWQTVLEDFKIWQHLTQATQSYERERCVVNLRHIGDILSEYSEYYRGTDDLLTWFEQQLNNPQQREWEMERKLSNSEGVQLLTIHKSKGLEFKIVFLLFANKKSANKQKDELIFSVSDQQQRVISLQSTDDTLPIHEERKNAEQHRLWYVALTRASYRIYALLHAVDDAKRLEHRAGIDFWRNVAEHSNDLDKIQPPLNQAPTFHYQANQQTVEHLTAHAMPQERFYRQTRTSFSRLTASAFGYSALYDNMLNPQKADDEQRIQHILAQQNQLLNFNQSPDSETDTFDELLWIQQHFPKGVQAGTLLHHILEQLDFADIALAQSQHSHKQHLSLELERCFKHGFLHLKQALLNLYLGEDSNHDQHQLAEQQLYDDILQWLYCVVSTPLFKHLALQHLTARQCIHELEFCLYFNQKTLDSQHIEQLFAQYGFHLSLNGRDTDQYLVGAIDLICFDGERYHIVDYKSNDLGTQSHDYHYPALLNNILQSQYILQASLYLVALHRYLHAHLVQYEMDKHLGHAYYLYLRGMTGEAEQGVIQCPIPLDLIQQLDDYLGSQIATTA